MSADNATQRRRILFLTPQMPYPPEQGTAIRNYNLIVQVARRHDVALLSFVHDALAGSGPLDEICSPLRTVRAPERSRGDRLRTLLTTRQPDMAHRLHSADFTAALRELVEAEEFDIIQVEGIELARYGLMIREWRGGRRPAVVLDDHNAEYVLQRRAFEIDGRRPSRWPAALYSWTQWRQLAHFERLACRRAEGVIAVSGADARALQRLVPGLRPLVVPNGVDVERYHPGIPDSLRLRHPALVFTGKMDFRPNVDAMLWFYKRVWPLIRARVAQVHFYVVGKSPHASLAPLMRDPSVTVTGYVLDILPYFGGADVYVAPLRIGGGTRLKILEAMAAGLPLISTTLGAEGIALVPGLHALLADDAESFARAALELLRRPSKGEALGAAARQFVVEQYDWRRIVPRLDEFYASL